MRAFPVDDGFNRKGRHTVLVVATYRVSTPTDLDIDQLVPFYSSGSRECARSPGPPAPRLGPMAPAQTASKCLPARQCTNASRHSVEMAGIEPASLKDRPDILRAQSMLSLLLGSCTHTDMVQTSPVTEKSRTASVTTAVQQAF